MLEKFEGEKRKQQLIMAVAIGLGAGGIFILSTLLGGGKERREEEPLPEVKIEDTKRIEEESFREVYGRELEVLKKKIEALEREKSQLEKKLERIKEEEEDKKVQYLVKREEELPEPEKLVPPPPPPARTVTAPSPPPTAPPPPPGAQTPPAELKDLIAMEFEEEEKGKVSEEVKGEREKRKKIDIPTGSFVKAVLLSGLDAPTGGRAQSNPHPVLFKVIDEAVLPNLWKADIKECFVIGSGYGDLSAERAYIRLEVLSCVKGDGTAVEKKINGYVAGEDGSVGLAGRVVSKQGQMLARALVAGFVEGVGRMFGRAGTTVVVSPQGGFTQTVNPSQAFQVGLSQGFSEAAKKLADFYMNLVNEMYPVVEINAGRKVDLVFLSPISFEEEEG